MRNKALLRNLLIFSMIIGNLTAIYGQVCLNNVFKGELSPDNHYHRCQWCILENNNIALTLIADEALDHCNYFAVIANNGEIIIGPDKVTKPQYGTFATFDETGILYLFGNPNYYWQMVRQKYNPLTGQLEEKHYPPSPYLGQIRAAKYLPGIGNVCFTVSSKVQTEKGKFTKPYKLIVDDAEGENFKAYEFDRQEGLKIPQGRITLHKISISEILVIGVSTYKGQNYLVKFIYNLVDDRFLPTEAVRFDDLIEEGAPEFKANTSIISQTFEYDGRIFFISPGYKPGNCQVIIAEMDRTGEIVSVENRAPLVIEEAKISKSPNDFVLLNGDVNSPGFWVLSLDNFPTLILDKSK